ncbi:maleylpyruvate isomerase family mycothiol-dependent enzyme [Cellulomonas sp. NPDC057328]|uniref:maleylpyruvate isomerase family mycothiol-dependent enzyme n=1 Tax=Cellulomonas sp. NPDC057328 TaxID=3346101 RepID=UPI003639C981
MTSDVSAPPVPAGPVVRPPGCDATYLDVLAHLQDAFLDGARRADPQARVPWCGRWRVRDLVVHLARIHHWAAAEAARRREVPLGRGPFVLDELYARCAAELRGTLAALDPGAPSSTLLGPGPAVFWHRRQVHETLVHLVDLQRAAGLPGPAPVAGAPAPALWADTVDELVTVMQPRQVRLGRTPPLAVQVRVDADDAGRSWTLGAAEPDGGGPDGAGSDGAGSDGAGLEGAGSEGGEPDVVVTGPAQDLALLLWRRTTPDDARLRVRGDRAALDVLLGSRLVP